MRILAITMVTLAIWATAVAGIANTINGTSVLWNASLSHYGH